MTTAALVFAALALANAVAFVALLRRHCLVRGRVRVNPFLGVLGGFAYYVFLPALAMGLFGDTIASWTTYRDYLSLENGCRMLGLSLLLLGCLGLGGALPQRLVASPGRPPRRPARAWRSRHLPLLGLVVATLALLALAYSIRGFLSGGYDERVLDNDAVWSTRGTMSSFFTVIVLCIAATLLWSRRRLSAPVRWGMVAAFGVGAAVLLSIGARLYVAMGLVTLLATASVLLGGIRWKVFLGAMAGAAVLFAGVGVLRLGSIDSGDALLVNLALEPLLTSLSLVTLLSDNPTIWFGRPHLFPYDLLAVLPSVVYPDKALLFERLADYGYAFEAPLGGFHLFFSLLVNAGWIGSAPVAVGFGWVLRRLGSETARTSAGTLTAVLLTGACVFSLFRDPFFISLAKNVLVMSVAVPAVLCFLESLQHPGSRRRDAPDRVPVPGGA